MSFLVGMSFYRWGRMAGVAGGCVFLTGCIDEPAPFRGERLGAVTDHNIAVMVDRPSDLEAPRRDRPRDSVKREASLSTWRGAGQPAAGATQIQGGSRP
jgi:hypothetical protein